MKEDWDLLVSFFPDGWRQQAVRCQAVKGLRQDKETEDLLRTLLLHTGCGHSLRQTVARARRAGLANLSDVALLKRLRKSEEWLWRLCRELFGEREIAQASDSEENLRLIDATQVKEPGKAGRLWRIHYSLRLSSLRCDFLELTAAKGEGTGESLRGFDAQRGEHLMGDRAYSAAPGLYHIAASGADLTVRLSPQNVRLFKPSGESFPLKEQLKKLSKPNEAAEWEVLLTDQNNSHAVRGRICALRKSRAAITQSKKKLRRRAQKSGEKIEPSTWFYAEFVMVFSTVAAQRLSAREILDLYRIRWQVELVFKRFKQLVGLGSLPKSDQASARAWLYGKLFAALLTEKLIAHAETFSPWGY